MVEKELVVMITQLEMFDLFPLMKPTEYLDPDTGQPDDTWLHPCKVRAALAEFRIALKSNTAITTLQICAEYGKSEQFCDRCYRYSAVRNE